MPLLQRLAMRFLPDATQLSHVRSQLAARHADYSIIASADDDCGKPNNRLFDLAADAIRISRDLTLDIFASRTSTETKWFDVWPGEHYRLLAAFVRLLNPKTVIEIGTASGMGTLALSQEMKGGTVYTFDLIPWQDFSGTWLAKADFEKRVVQKVDDVSVPQIMDTYKGLFEDAELIFVDGPKDGMFEPKFISLLGKLNIKKGTLLIFDDIRVLNMIVPWRRIDRPKLDLTSFGHWSGTGLVDWTT